MVLVILRAVFIIISIGLGIFLSTVGELTEESTTTWWGFVVGIPMIAIGIVGADCVISRKRLDAISALYFGLIVGLFLAYVGGLALTPFLMITDPEKLDRVRPVVQLILAPMLCYICISLLMQTRDDFRFIIPYVEFAREFKGSKPLVLDTSVIIDGRIADVLDTRVFDGQLIMPKFVIGELQGIADSSDKTRRSRGRRGLDILNRLRTNPEIDLEIFDRELSEFAGQPVDLKLVILAKHLEGKLVTNDYNLNKVARLQGVDVINLNDVANALKPVFLPGEQIEVRILKAGEEPGQGVGYLEDGTMVVVEAGREHVNRQVAISVTSVLQTSAGRMVFGKYEGRGGAKA